MTSDPAALFPLGRREPTDFEHVAKYPLRSVIATTPITVEKRLMLPWWHSTHDQGREGSCVGHACAMERAITNTAQNRMWALLRPSRRYDPLDIWNQAKVIDEWPETNPGDSQGTSVRAAYDVLRDRGACRVRSMKLNTNGDPYPVGLQPPDAKYGVAANRWAASVDEMRAGIAAGVPIVIGVNWYENFDEPQQIGQDFWIGRPTDLGNVRGGHAVCVYGASDRREAFRVKNSWGSFYPLVWLPYKTMGRLLDEHGEAALPTDR